MIDPSRHSFPWWDYGFYLKNLIRTHGWRAWIRQFRYSDRRPDSRRLIAKMIP